MENLKNANLVAIGAYLWKIKNGGRKTKMKYMEGQGEERL